MHRAILTLLDGGRRTLPCELRFVRSIGAPLSPDLIASLESALHAPVIEGYGLTEVGAATSNPLPPGQRKPGSVGTVTGAEVAVFDASGLRLAPGVEGEIRIRGARLHPVIGTTRKQREPPSMTAGCGPAIWAASMKDGYLRQRTVMVSRAR